MFRSSVRFEYKVLGTYTGGGLDRKNKSRLNLDKTEVLLVGPALALTSRHTLMLDGAALLW